MLKPNKKKVLKANDINGQESGLRAITLNFKTRIEGQLNPANSIRYLLFVTGLPTRLLARLPDCQIARLPDGLTIQKARTLKLIVFILLSLCFIFLSGCTTRKSLQQKLFLSWPLKTAPKISRDFSLRSPHDGIDIVAPMNKEIFSAHEGYVVYAGRGYNGYGNLIILDSGQGWSTFYAHLNRIFVKEGLFVQRGDMIGTVGMTGRTSGPHLHFELRQNKMPVDPKKYLP